MTRNYKEVPYTLYTKIVQQIHLTIAIPADVKKYWNNGMDKWSQPSKCDTDLKLFKGALFVMPLLLFLLTYLAVLYSAL
jgi:hypothetical protein